MRARYLLSGVAVCVGAAAAGSVQHWIGAVLALSGDPVAASNKVLSEHELEEIATLPPQKQAERLLQRAVNGYKGALDQIESRAEAWRGQIEINHSLNGLTQVAYNSGDVRVRAAAVEISLAGYSVAKNSQSVEDLVRHLKESTEGRPWRLWVLGLLGNRGVELAQVERTLVDYSRDPVQETRKWAVNAIAMLGTDEIIPLLIEIFRTDPSHVVRERAGCGLADSGMLTKEQRKKALPDLMRMMDDPTLDAQTRRWVFQALREISGNGEGDDPAAWRDWWAKAGRA